MIIDQLIENVIQKQKEKKKSLVQFKKLILHENLDQRVKAIKEIQNLINQSNYKQAFFSDRIHVYIFEQCIQESVDSEFFKIASSMIRNLFEEDIQAAMQIIDRIIVMLHKPKYSANMNFYVTIRHIITSVAATQTLLGSSFMAIYTKFYNNFVQQNTFNFQMTNSFSYQQYLASIQNKSNSITENSQTSNLSLDEDRAHSLTQTLTHPKLNLHSSALSPSKTQMKKTAALLKKNTLSTQSLLSNFGVTLFEDDEAAKKITIESIAEGVEGSIDSQSNVYSMDTSAMFDSVMSSTSFFSASEAREIDTLEAIDTIGSIKNNSSKTEKLTQKITNLMDQSDSSFIDNHEIIEPINQQFEQLAISGPMAHPYVEPRPRPHFVPPLNLSFLNKPGIREVSVEESEQIEHEVTHNFNLNPQKAGDTDTAFKDQVDQVHDAKKGQILMSEIGQIIGQFTALSDYTTISTLLVKQEEYDIIPNLTEKQNIKQQYINILTKNNSREYEYFDIDFMELDNYIDIINSQKPENITRIGFFYLLYQICINSGNCSDVYGKDIITSMTLDLAYLRSRKQGMLPATIISITTFYKSVCLMEIPHICDTWMQNLENMYSYVNIQFKFFDEVSQKYITKEEKDMKVTERRVVEKHIPCTLIDKFQGYTRSRVILLTIICDKIAMLVQHYNNLSALEDISVCLGVLYDVMCATKSFGLIRKAVVDLCFPSLLKLLSLLIERKIRARQYYIFISHRLLQIFNNLMVNNYKTNDYQQNNINQMLLNLFLHQQIPVNYWLKRYAYFILMNSRVMIEVSGLYTNHEQCEESFVQIRQTFFMYIMNLSELITHYYYTMNFNLNQDAQQIPDINIEYCNFGIMSNTAEQNFPRGIDDNFDLKLDIEQLPLNMMLQNLVNKQTMNQLRNKTLFQKQKNTVKDNKTVNNFTLEGFDFDYIADYEVGVVMQYLINHQEKVMNDGKDRKLYLTCLQAFERFINIPTIISQLQKPQLNQFIIFHYLSFLKFYNSCLQTYGQFIISNFQLAAAHLLVLQKFTQIDDYEVKQHIHSIGIVEFLTQQLDHEVNMPNNIEIDTSSSTVSYTIRSNSTLTFAELDSEFFENDIKTFAQIPSVEQSEPQTLKYQFNKIEESSYSDYETESSRLSDIPINQPVTQKRPQIAQLPISQETTIPLENVLGTGRKSVNQPLIKKKTLQLLPGIGNLPEKNDKQDNQSFMIDASIPMLNLNYNDDNIGGIQQEKQISGIKMQKISVNQQLEERNDVEMEQLNNTHEEIQLQLQPDKIVQEMSDYSSESYSDYDSDDLSDIPIQPQIQQKPNVALESLQMELQLPPPKIELATSETIPLNQMETTKVPLISNRSLSDSFDNYQQQKQTDFNGKFHLIHGLKSSKKVQPYQPQKQTVGIPNIPIYYDDNLHEVLIILLMHLIIKQSTQTFDPYYVTQFPNSQGMTNILFILHQHLNHKNNQTVVNKLLDNQYPPAIKRLLRLLCYQQFNTSFYNLDKFTLVAKGAFGDVYYGNVDLIKFKDLEAYSTPVALKIQPLSKDIYDRCVLHDLYNEITAMERLQEYQSFCQIYDYGVTPQGYVMVMQKYHTSFRDFRRQLFTKPGKQVNVNMLPRYGHEESMMKYVRIFLFTYMMLLEQLQIMHQNKVIHFDLKTDNIFVAPATVHWICLNELPRVDNTGDFQRSLLNKFLKIYNQYQLPYSITLGDFGESYIYSSESDKQTLLARGTEFNKSPEMLTATNGNMNQQFLHGRQQGSGPPSDVWSAACTLYEILTGDYLFYDTDWFRFFVRVTTVEQNIEYGKDSFTFSNCPEAVQCIRGLRLTPQKKAMLGNCQPLIDLLEFQLVQVPMYRPSIHQCIEMTRHVINVYFPHSYNYVDGTNQQQFEAVSTDTGLRSAQLRQSSRKSERPGIDTKNKNVPRLDFVMQNCKFPEVAWDFTIHQTPNETMENIFDVLTPHATIINSNMNIKGVKLQMIKQKQPSKPSDVLGNGSIWLGNVNDLQNFQFIAENNIQTIVDCTTTNINLKNGFVSRVFRPNNKLFQLFRNEIKVLKKDEFKKLIILLDQIADVVRCTFTLNGCLLFIDETSNHIAANLSLFCIMEFQLMHLYQSTVYLKQLRPGAKVNINFMELLLFWHEKRHKIGMKMLSLFSNTKLRINRFINMHDSEIYNFATTRVSQANYRCVCGRTFFLIKPKVETQYVICNCVISDEYGRVRDQEGIYIDCPTSSCRTIQNYYMQLFGLKLYKLVWAYLPSEGLISNCDHATRQVADMPELKDSMRNDFQLHSVDETRAPLYRLQNKPGWTMYYCVLCGSPTHCIKATKSGTEVAVLATFSNK